MRRSNDSVGDYGDTPGQLGAMAARGFDAAVSSPPYIDSINSRENGIDWEKIKPDYPGRQMHAERIAMAERHHNERRYGDTNGQLGAMAAGDFAAAVSSPPFEDSLSRDVVNPVDRVTFARAHGISNAEHVSPIDMERAYSRDQEYGCTVGQLGAMHGRFDAVVSSPPFQEQQTGGGLARTMVLDDGKPLGRNCGYQYQATVDGNLGAMTGEFDAAVTSPPYQTGGHHQHQMDAWNTNGRGQSGHSGGYADESDGQVQGDGNDFWLAARAVVTQTYQVLAPGAISVWVCKDFVRNKQRVPFSDQWRQLCAACGFELVEWVHASLVTDNGVQVGLFGEDVALRKERKSFFRRLAENKGSPRIDWEDVLFMRRV